MKKFALITTLLVALVCLINPISYAFTNKDVKKAKEFEAAGMYPQAIALLEKRINDKPTDAEAHFELGTCYIYQGGVGKAEERFASAVRLDPEYGYEIGGKYMEAANNYLKKGDFKQAKRLYGDAVRYDPVLKSKVAKKCVEYGASYLDKMQSQTADELFSYALSYDRSVDTERDRITTEYGRKMLEIAKTKEYRSEQDKYLIEAKKYLPQPEIELVKKKYVWVKVGPIHEYAGKGWDDNDSKEYHITCMEYGKDFKFTDRIVMVADGEFKVYGKNNRNEISRWLLVKNKFVLHCDYGGKSGSIHIEGQVNQLIRMVPER